MQTIRSTKLSDTFLSVNKSLDLVSRAGGNMPVEGIGPLRKKFGYLLNVFITTAG
jgi:hypothetical protein